MAWPSVSSSEAAAGNLDNIWTAASLGGRIRKRASGAASERERGPESD